MAASASSPRWWWRSSLGLGGWLGRLVTVTVAAGGSRCCPPCSSARLCVRRSCPHRPRRPSPHPASCLAAAWAPIRLLKLCWEVSAGGQGVSGRAHRACLSSCVGAVGRQEGTGSGQSSPDLSATRIRPVSTPSLRCSPPPNPIPDPHKGVVHPHSLCTGGQGNGEPLASACGHLLPSLGSSVRLPHHPAEPPTPSWTSADPGDAPGPPRAAQSSPERNMPPVLGLLPWGRRWCGGEQDLPCTLLFPELVSPGAASCPELLAGCSCIPVWHRAAVPLPLAHGIISPGPSAPPHAGYRTVFGAGRGWPCPNKTSSLHRCVQQL